MAQDHEIPENWNPSYLPITKIPARQSSRLALFKKMVPFVESVLDFDTRQQVNKSDWVSTRATEDIYEILLYQEIIKEKLLDFESHIGDSFDNEIEYAMKVSEDNVKATLKSSFKKRILKRRGRPVDYRDVKKVMKEKPKITDGVDIFHHKVIDEGENPDEVTSSDSD